MGPDREAKQGVGKRAAHADAADHAAVGKSTLSGALPAPIPDDAELVDGRYAWRLGADDVFTCTRDPGGASAARITVSAVSDPARWNALGQRWMWAAPGRTWPRGRGAGRFVSPAATSGPAPMSVDPLAGLPSPETGAGDVVALAFELGKLSLLSPSGIFEGTIDVAKYVHLFGNGTAVHGAAPAFVHYNRSSGAFMMLAPAIQLDGLRAPGFVARTTSLLGVTVLGRLSLSQAELTYLGFTNASLHTCAMSVGGQDVHIGAIEVAGGALTVSAHLTEPLVGSLRFARAEVRGAAYPGAPPIDVAIAGGSLFDIEHAVGAKLARGVAVGLGAMPPAFAPPPTMLPALDLPKAPLEGTRFLVDIDRLAGGRDAPLDQRIGGFRRLSALLVRDDTGPSRGFPQVLASVALEDVHVFDGAATISGTIGKLRASGSPSFMLALLDSPEVRTLPEVAPVIDQIRQLGLLPTAGAAVSFDHVIFGKGGGSLGVRGDVAVELDVPGLGTLHVGLAHGGAESSPRGDAAGGTLTVSARDATGPIAELVADGVVAQAKGDATATLKRVRATGDIARLLRATDKVTLPPRLAAALATVRGLDLGLGASVDEAKLKLPASGAVSIELAGDARAWLDAGAAGGVDVSVARAHVDHPAGTKTTVGSVTFDRFEAHLAPRARPGAPPREAASISIDHARADNTRSPVEVTARMIDVRGDTAAIQTLAAALRREGTGLPPLVKHALDVVRRLDLDGARALAAKHEGGKDPVPDWNASTGAHVALALPGGRLNATLSGFMASHRRDSVVADFESLELTLDDTRGKRAARIAVRGGHGYVQDPDRGGTSGAMDVGAQLDDIVADGNTTRLLDVLDKLPGSLPGPLATALSFVRQHRQALAATGRVRAQHVELARIDGRVDATAGPITARVALPHGVLVASLTGARANEDELGFDTLDLDLANGGAALRMSDAAWRPHGAATIGAYSAHGNLPKLAPVLDDKTLAMLPPAIASAIRATHGTVATVVGGGASIDAREVRTEFLDLRADLGFTHDGKQYEAKGAIVRVFGGRTELDGPEGSSAIAADHLYVSGRFTGPVAGRTATGQLELRTGKAMLRRGGGAMRLECHDIRGSGLVDAPAPKGPDDRRIVEHDQQTATAVELAPLLRDLELDTHTPIKPGAVGQGLVSTTIAPGTQLDLHVRATSGTMSQIEATVTPPISLFGQAHGVAVIRGKASVDLRGFVDLLTLPAASTAQDWVGASVDIPKLVEHVAGKLRENLVEEIHAKDNLAVEPGLIEKTLGPLKRDLKKALAYEETSGTGRARLSGQIPRLDLSVDSQLSGRIDRGQLQLRGAGSATWGSVDGGRSRVEVDGLGVATSELPTGERLAFHGLRMDRFVWFDLSK